MELITPEEFTIEHVTDIDFCFQYGGIVQHTLREKDSYRHNDSRYWLSFASGEEIVVYAHSLAWVSMRERDIKTPVKKEPPKDLAAPLDVPPPFDKPQA